MGNKYIEGKYKVSFEVFPEEAKEQVIKFLNLLHINGILGATRVFGIKDATCKEERDWEIFFDGDGNNRLENIKIEKL